ncbi:hypothetical protein [Leptobacterium sp. I13]|uniref:hypothetical protein n=1 Tax=Leptobacterium meishanense TaxID=3128904 RepID=UPI0030EF071A
MPKTYKATNLYYYKVLLLIIVIGLVYFFYDLFVYALLSFFNTYWARNIAFFLIGLFTVIALVMIFFVIRSNKPTVVIEESALTYRNQKIFFKEIVFFQPGKGGSEPYLITKKDKRIDLELSWLKKSDRIEIETILQVKTEKQKSL